MAEETREEERIKQFELKVSKIQWDLDRVVTQWMVRASTVGTGLGLRGVGCSCTCPRSLGSWPCTTTSAFVSLLPALTSMNITSSSVPCDLTMALEYLQTQ